MALSNEDKKDVKSAFGKAMANKVSKVTHDQHAQTKKNNSLMIRMDRKRERNRIAGEAKSKALSNTKDSYLNKERKHNADYMRKSGNVDVLANRKSIGRHGAKTRALSKKGGAISRGATGTLDERAANRRIKKHGSVLGY